MLETLFSALTAKVAAGAISAVTAAGLVAGATGHLPDAMQDGLNQAAARIGISIPAGDQDQPVDTTTEQLNTEEPVTEELDTNETGGEDRSPTADAVRSVIDEYHGEPGEFGKSQSQSDDPSAFGRAVSDAASNGRASEGREAGTAVADDKRQERPAATNEASDTHRPTNPPADVPANEASDAHRPQDPPADAGQGQRPNSVERPTRP